MKSTRFAQLKEWQVTRWTISHIYSVDVRSKKFVPWQTEVYDTYICCLTCSSWRDGSLYAAVHMSNMWANAVFTTTGGSLPSPSPPPPPLTSDRGRFSTYRTRGNKNLKQSAPRKQSLSLGWTAVTRCAGITAYSRICTWKPGVANVEPQVSCASPSYIRWKLKHLREKYILFSASATCV